MSDLWGPIALPDDPVTPLSVMLEQSEILRQKTDGHVWLTFDTQEMMCHLTTRRGISKHGVSISEKGFPGESWCSLMRNRLRTLKEPAGYLWAMSVSMEKIESEQKEL